MEFFQSNKKKIIIILTITVLVTCGVFAYGYGQKPKKNPGTIYLYGEQHSSKHILDEEFSLWSDHYHNQGMRHLFIESGYPTAEFLNLWMKADNDEIWDMLYQNTEGTAAHSPEVAAFYKQIKNECPETIFHGTDVEHQYASTGQQYLKYLKSTGQQNSSSYRIAKENLEQGKAYSASSDDVYRENKMFENFIREFNSLKDKDVMGIYGSAHTHPEALDYITQTVPRMAGQLYQIYGDAVQSQDLTLNEGLSENTTPLRMDTIKVEEKEYSASYFGKEKISVHGCQSREFWRLEDAYEDFKENPVTGNVLPYNNYPMKIDTGQIFVIDYTMTDGSVERTYFRSSGAKWYGAFTTEEILLGQNPLQTEKGR